MFKMLHLVYTILLCLLISVNTEVLNELDVLMPEIPNDWVDLSGKTNSLNDNFLFKNRRIFKTFS